MIVTFFAAARDATGVAAWRCDDPVVTTVGDLRKRIMDQFPGIRMLLSRCAIAVNQEYASDEQSITTTDEIAVLPPVSGG
jgi:molybdopterin converting factor subunit 1